ncbi:hypothetical protein [Wenyingzhuangia sp. 2_MG-2023]|uniref:hypothetical protein n=1 Tax=Wenyingzhuangia sp. 2_MG-2023 TaxID=3062639 RepID=UPI0026E17AB0|nr:hypothetical protein [Wenyingzhuangia sp. 2_MG-2023]MDO6736874.1 hypothetical protein [Wenyingzhuangia sp. 2_MG-2023]
MKKQHTKIATIICLYMMVFCVVFSTNIKNFVDSVNDDEKTSQVLGEEENHVKEDTQKDKDFFSFSTVKQIKPLKKLFKFNKNTLHKCRLSAVRPYFKIHTPPPDYSIFC